MYARDDQPLPPILSDGIWTVPFEFFAGGTGSSQTLDQSGTTWSLEFAPKGRSQPAAADVHELTTAVNGGLTVAGSVITASWSNWTGWTPGLYAVELRQTNLGAPIPVYVGTVAVARGLSDLAALGQGAVLPAGVAPAAQIYVQSQAVQVVRGEASESALQAAASAATATAEAALAHADRLAADADLATVVADQTATHADKLAADGDASAAHTDKLAADGDASAAHTDRLAADGDKTAADADLAAIQTLYTQITTWPTKTAAYTLNAGDQIGADSTGGSFPLTLPAAPPDGTVVLLTDPTNSWGANPVTLLRNGASILGVADDLSLDASGTTFGLRYKAVATNWSFV